MQPGVKLASYRFSCVNVNWNVLRVKFAPIANRAVTLQRIAPTYADV